MSSEQEEPAVASPEKARRRIVVAQKPAEKPLAFITRDAELAPDFEEQVGRRRPVVVFPSLTHFCTDSSRLSWGGVVVARACGWDPRLLHFVPSTAAIAFWRVAEEGYGWPASVQHLNSGDELTAWLEALGKPSVLNELKARKRNVSVGTDAGARAPSRRRAQKPQLTFALATPRGTVSEQPVQMELDGLAAKRAQNEASEAKAAQVNPSSTPVATQKPAVVAAEHATSAVKRGAESAARGAPSPRRTKGRPGSTPAEVSEATAVGKREKSAAPGHASLFEELGSSVFGGRPFSARAPEVALRPARESALADARFMTLAAELGLVRAGSLLDELRARAHSMRG